MKIISLQTENIKCLKAVEITPAGQSIEIAGKNGQGKSSVLDSIFYALGGKSGVCERPIRDGESAAAVRVELDDYIVTRTFTASGGGSLKITARDETKITSPQALLDNLVGTLTFDPLSFAKMDSRASVLRKLVGLDFTEIDAEAALIYDKRTEVNRQSSRLVAQRDALKFPAETPDAGVDVGELVAKRQEADRHNRVNQSRRAELARLNSCRNDRVQQIESLQKQIADLKAQLDVAADSLTNLDQTIAKVGQECSALQDQDLSVFDAQITNAGKINEAVRNKAEFNRINLELDALRIESNRATDQLSKIEKIKEERLAKAKFPVEGLGFSSSGTVTFNGVPFEQISTAERLRVSAAIGIALNPKLRVMLIRDGSVLDDEALGALKFFASQHDTQLWIERVGKLSGELPGVIIEDGEVVHSTLPEAIDSKNTTCV